jgi:hypothetical protein
LFYGFWVDAARAKEEEFLDVILMGSVDDVGLDHQILVDEVGWVGVVGVDAPYFCCG